MMTPTEIATAIESPRDWRRDQTPCVEFHPTVEVTCPECAARLTEVECWLCGESYYLEEP